MPFGRDKSADRRARNKRTVGLKPSEVDPRLEDYDGIGDAPLAAIDRAITLQQPIAQAYVRRLSAKHSEWSRDDLLDAIDKRFVSLLTASGAAIGGTASVPGVGTIAAIALTAGEAAAFAEAAAFLGLAYAAAYRADVVDPSARRTLIYGIILGETGNTIITKFLGQQGAQWSGLVTGRVPSFVTRSVNDKVSRWLVRHLTIRLGTRWAGRLVPFGIGAVIGGIGNATIGKRLVAAARDIFDEAAPVLDARPRSQIDPGSAAGPDDD